MKENRKMLGNALLILTAMIWGTAFVFQRVGMESIEPITFNASRMALAAVAVGAVSALPSQARKRKLDAMSAAEREAYRRNTIIGGICCGSFLAAASIFQQMGIVYTTAGKAGFITAMYMLLVPVIGFVLFGRRNSWIVWLAVLMGVVGMYFLCMTESLHLNRGDTLVCICAVLFSGHILCCDHFAGIGDPIRISAIQFAACTVLSAAAAWILRDRLRRHRLHAADHRAEVYGSRDRIAPDESGVRVCGHRGRTASGRENERPGDPGVCHHVRRDRAGTDPGRVREKAVRSRRRISQGESGSGAEKQEEHRLITEIAARGAALRKES